MAVAVDTWTPRLGRLLAAPGRIQRSLYPEAKQLAVVARPLTPYLTGRLMRTGMAVETAEGADVRYGRPDAPYAAAVYFGRPRSGQRLWLAAARMRTTQGRLARLRTALDG